MGIRDTLVPSVVRESYLRKFTLIVVVVVVATAVFGVVVRGEVSGLLLDDARTEVESSATLNAENVEQWVRSKEQAARMLSNYQVSKQGNLSDIRERFRDELDSLGGDIVDVHYVTVGTSEPQILTSTDSSLAGPSGEPANISLASLDVEWQGERLSSWMTGVATSHVYQREGTKRIAFVASVEATRQQNSGAGVMIVANATASSAALENPTSSGFTRIVDDRSIVEFSEDPVRIGRVYMRGRETTAYTRGSQGLVGTTNMTTTDGQALLVGYAPIEGTNWVAISHVPREQALQLQRTVSRDLLVLIGLFLAGLLVVGVTIGRGTVRSLNDLADRAGQLEAGNLDTEIETRRDDEFGTVYSAFDSMRDALRIQIQKAEQARKEAEVSRAEAMEMNEYFREKAEEYSGTMQACAAGDLTRRMEPDGQNEAMDRIAAEFNEMIEELELTVGQLKTFADDVRESGRTARASAETVRTASEQVAESIQKISDETDRRTREIDEIAGGLETVAADLDDLAEGDGELESLAARADGLSDRLDKAAAGGEQTLVETENVAGAAEEQAAELNEMADRAAEMTRSAEYLGDGLAEFRTESEHEFIFQIGEDDES